MASEEYQTSKTTETITNTPQIDPYEARVLPTYQAQTDAVNNQYDAAINSQKLALENAYNQNRTELERAAEKIPETYNAALNNQASAYERQRQAFNERAAGNGIGTGTGSQAALAMNIANQGNMASLNKARADAITEAQNKITDLHTSYQNSVAEAIAKNDYERAVQMLSEYRAQAQSVVNVAQAQADEDYRAYQSQLEREGTSYSRTQEQAKLLSQYGDFSGYESLYGADTANNMKQAWIASNPDLAYNTGAIDAKRYKEITGKNPLGYSAPGGGGSGYKPTYYGGGGGGGDDKEYTYYDLARATATGDTATLNAIAKSNNYTSNTGSKASDAKSLTNVVTQSATNGNAARYLSYLQNGK